MAIREIKDTFFYKIDGQTVGYSLLQKSGLSLGQFYITISDRYNFNAGRDVDIYKVISSRQADVYKANKYNYQSVATSSPPAPKNDSLYQSITIDGRAIGRVICNNQVVWQKARVMLLDLSSARGLQVSYNANTITIIFDTVPNSKQIEEFFAASNKDLLLTIDNQSYDVVSAEYVKFASLVKFTVTQSSSYKTTTATNVTVAVKTDDTAQSQVLLFDGRPTKEFTNIGLYKTYIFERQGYPPVTKEATDHDFGILEIGDGYLAYNKTTSGLYIRSSGTAFDVKIYGKN